MKMQELKDKFLVAFPYIFFFVTVFFLNICEGRDHSTKMLAKNKLLGTTEETCVQVENRLGQLLYVNVDGFAGPNEGPSISKAYIDMVEDLQIGGVLPHTTNSEYSTQKKALNELQNASKLPLMIGVDYLYLNDTSFGLGFGPGFLKKNGYLKADCVNAKSFLQAFLHKAAGLNHALGPTIEQNKTHGFLAGNSSTVSPMVNEVIEQFNSIGVATTMKHFPYTPEDYNLHTKSEDSRFSEDKVQEMLSIFKKTAGRTSFAMSTHLFNSKIDPEDMATFSKKWVKILREDIGFKGILMTDALFMFKHYDATTKKMSSKWPQDQIAIADIYTIFAARSILAGHDMVFLEGTKDSTYKIFNNLLQIACSGKPIGDELKSRIFASYDVISKWKVANQKALKEILPLSVGLVDDAVKLSKEQCPNPEEFTAFKTKVGQLGLSQLPKDSILTDGVPLRSPLGGNSNTE